MNQRQPGRVLLGLLAYAVAVAAYCLVANELPVWVRDTGRFITLAVAATIFGMWGLIMSRSYKNHRDARADGDDADLPLHIWVITFAFLGYVAASAWRTFELLGHRFEIEAAPTSLYFGPVALYALWLFASPKS